ncbi:tetratricopeptide repeat protein 39B-like [Mytilus californianus]|uniref:tetratricopeptide repeat protein 39B-like n=1 Tax=Mytilus californianus TaxID=6549 RepID=UPI0022461D27|nr:tetratricopeptide repeat protein 39B-like [Mytilus californianus]
MATNNMSTEEIATGEENDEEFEDAEEEICLSKLDLSDAIDQTSTALKLFLNNKFTDAKARMEPGSSSSMYHALGYGTILYIQAVMTFDMTDIEAAIQALKKSLHVCDRHRRKYSFTETITRSGIKTSQLKEDEIHAELCYAECLLLRALLTFVQDENLISFVKGGLKIRECYKVYKECNKILLKRNFADEKQKLHFESGVLMGVGAFNLMISLLPSKVMKLLEFVGFSGNKKAGLQALLKGTEDLSSLRGPLCSIILIAYHTVVCYVLGLGDGDISLAEELLKPCLKLYPKGALFLFFSGRIEEIKGNIDNALYRFEESIDSQQEWRQFHHLCFWELMWCHCFKGDWLMAMKYAERLCKESRWSKATYTYQKAAFLLMCDDQTEETKTHLHYLFSEVPRLKQRIAGKSLPIEKFAVFKAKRVIEQDYTLVLPALELIYVWNGFSILGKKEELLNPVLEKVEKTVNDIVNSKDDRLYYADDYCLALLLKGVCLKHKGSHFQAEQCFTEILTYEKQIKQDTFLIPYATVELAMLFLLEERLDDVKKFLDRAKKNYKGYLLESRLHFRIHAIRLQMNSMQSSDSSSNNSSQVLESPTDDIPSSSLEHTESIESTNL